MPTFEIPDGPTAIDAPRSSDATAAYSITNTSSASCDARLSVVPAGNSKTEWLTVDGNRERTFAPGETQTATVRAKFPPDAPAGEYPFRLRAVAMNDPDNDHAEGPMTVANLGGGPAPKKSLMWLWLLIGAVVAIALAGGIYYFLSRDTSEPTVTDVAENTPAPTAPAPPPAPTKIDTAQALQLAEKKTGDWIAAFNDSDTKTLTELSEPPFLFDSGLLFSKGQIEKKYAAMFADSHSEDFKVTKLTSYTIANLKKLKGFEADTDRGLNALKLDDDDAAVVVTTERDGLIFYFKRTDQDVQMRGFWG